MVRLRSQNHIAASDAVVLAEPRTQLTPRSTQWHRDRGRQTKQQSGEKRRYTTTAEDHILCAEIIQHLDLNWTELSQRLCNRAFDLKCQRLTALGLQNANQRIKPPRKNWLHRFMQRHQDTLQMERIVGHGWQQRSGLWGKEVTDFVAEASDLTQLCPECASIEAKLKKILVRARPSEFRRIHAFEAISASVVKSSCKLCRFVLACADSWIWPSAVKYTLDICHLENVLGPVSSANKLLFSLTVAEEHSNKVHRGWIVPMSLDNHRGLMTPDSFSLKAKVCFATIQNWLSFCDSNHSESCGATGRDNIPFFRLIDNTTRSIVDAPPNSKFAALSYCWGPSTPSFQHYANELPRIAPLVIEDALEASRRLGIPYLWVDRYCVTQDELSPVKSIQLQNMHKVYRSAYVTIIAGCGEGPEFGLPGISTRARKPQISVKTHGHHLFCMPDVSQEIRGCNWSTRGWTFQENLLSRRRLVFTESQAYFQCWHMHCCEAVPTCLPRAHTKDLKRFKDRSYTFRVFPPNGIGKAGIDIDMRIQEYLSRSLTKESDILNAFLGIFQAFRELQDPVLDFWGLPMSSSGSQQGGTLRSSNISTANEQSASFLSSLAWSDSTCNLASVRTLIQRLGFPSWSWAAWRSIRTFSRKSIPWDPRSPCITFRSLRNVTVALTEYEKFLAFGTSVTLLQPVIFASGWVADVWLKEEDDSTFTIRSPIPTHRVCLVLSLESLQQIRRRHLAESFLVLLLGGESCDCDGKVVSQSWKDVYAILLQSLPNGMYIRLGVVTWSLLGKPCIDEDNGTMRVKELFKAQRVFAECNCGCQMASDPSFEQYLQDDSHVMDFRKAKIMLA